MQNLELLWARETAFGADQPRLAFLLALDAASAPRTALSTPSATNTQSDLAAAASAALVGVGVDGRVVGLVDGRLVELVAVTSVRCAALDHDPSLLCSLLSALCSLLCALRAMHVLVQCGGSACGGGAGADGVLVHFSSRLVGAHGGARGSGRSGGRSDRGSSA